MATPVRDGFVVELFKLINFADDTMLITNLNSEDARNQSLNYELANFHNWLKANKSSLNINKTKAMFFHMPQTDTTSFDFNIRSIH